MNYRKFIIIMAVGLICISWTRAAHEPAIQSRKKVASFSISANDCSATQQTYHIRESGNYIISAHTQGETCYDCTGGDKTCHGPEGNSRKKGTRRGCPIGALGMSVEGRIICPGSFHQEYFYKGTILQFWFADDKCGDNCGGYQVEVFIEQG